MRRWQGALLVLAMFVGSARAEDAPQRKAPSSVSRTLGLGTLGFVTGFLAHEAGHVVTNLMLGNVPEFEGFLVWGFLPFFAIAPQIDCVGGVCTKRSGEPFEAGPRGKYAIVSAGYNVQHVTDEILLSRRPNLRYQDAPFHKGLLAFNIFLSGMYAVGSLTGIQDPHGDLAGMTRASGFHHVALSLLLLTPAGLDTYRYFVPDSRWAPWVSRGAKATFIGLTLAI
jgi:hypothetical protein